MINKLKNIFKLFSLQFPKITIVVMIGLTALLISGLKYLHQDDDMVKLLPDDMQSIITFHEITEEFGNYEFMYVAMGSENKNIFNKELLTTAWDISKEFENLAECEEVISISTMDKMYFDLNDSSIVIDDLMPQRNLSKNQIEDITEFKNFEYDGFYWEKDHFVKQIKK